MVQVCEGTKSKGVMLEEAIIQYKDIFMRAKNGFNNVLAVSLTFQIRRNSLTIFLRAFKTGWTHLQGKIIEVAAQVEAAAAEVGQEEVGEAAGPTTDLGPEEEVGVVQTATTTTITLMEVLVVVQAEVVVVVAEQEGEEEAHLHHHDHHRAGHLRLQMIYWTRTFSVRSLLSTFRGLTL